VAESGGGMRGGRWRVEGGWAGLGWACGRWVEYVDNGCCKGPSRPYLTNSTILVWDKREVN